MDIRTLTAAIVVDFEAVPGANGVVFPTEIGVATLYANKSAYLRPEAVWLPANPKWVGHHESLRGACEEGRPIRQVAEKFIRFARGKVLLSDACFVDQPLLDMVLGDDRYLVPRLTPFFPAVETCAQALGISPAELNDWIHEIDETRGPPHRAGEDARVRAALIAKLVARASA